MKRTTDVKITSRDDMESESAEQTAALVDVGESPGEATAIDGKVQERLGRQLKALYDDVVRQPIPDRLLSLMAQLEEKKGPGSV